MMKKASEEIRNRKTKTLKNMRKENNRFVSSLKRKRLPIRTPPIDHVQGLKKVTLYQIQKMGVGTLTQLPLLDLRPIPGCAARLPLRSRPLRRHENDSPLLHSRGLAVASFSRHSKARADELAAAEES
jgi:hypothetical protein